MTTGSQPNREALAKAQKIFRDAMHPLVMDGLHRVTGGNAARAIKNPPLPKSRVIQLERSLRETGGKITDIIDIADFPRLIQHYWKKTFSKAFANNKSTVITSKLWLIADGYEKLGRSDTSDLEPAYVRTQLFHIADLLKRIKKPGQAGAVSKIRNNLASLHEVSIGSVETAIHDHLRNFLDRTDITPGLHTLMANILYRPHRAMLYGALNIFRDAMRPFIVHRLSQVSDGNVLDAARCALQQGKKHEQAQRIKEFEKNLQRRQGNIEASIDISDFVWLIQYRPHWQRSFSAVFANEKGPVVVGKLWLIINGRDKVAHPDTSDLEAEYVRSLLFHIADLLQRIGKRDQADAVWDIRHNLASLSHIADLLQRIDKPGPTVVVSEIRDNPVSPNTPHEVPGESAEADLYNHLLRFFRQTDIIPGLHTLMVSILRYPHRAALNSALDIFRDMMRPSIVRRLRRISEGSIEDTVKDALPEEKVVQFKQSLGERGGDIAATIDINDFPYLIQYYWSHIFATFFKNYYSVRQTLWDIVKGRNRAAHPGMSDLPLEYVRTQLSRIIDLLQRINKPDQAHAVTDIRDNLGSLSHTADLLQRIDKPDQTDAAADIRDNRVSSDTVSTEAPPTQPLPDTARTKKLTTTPDMESSREPSEYREATSVSDPELTPAEQNREDASAAVLRKAQDIFRDAMRPFIASHLPNTRNSRLDIDDFPHWVHRHWDTFSEFFEDDATIRPRLWLIADGHHKTAGRGKTELAPAYVRAQLFHIANLLARIEKLDQAEAVAAIRHDLTPTDAQREAFDASAADILDNPLFRSFRQTYISPDFHTLMATILRHPNRAALDGALNIFRDAMRGFIVNQFGSNAEQAIKGSLPQPQEGGPSPRVELFEKDLKRTGGDIKICIDIGDFRALVQGNWSNFFSEFFQGDSTVWSVLRLIADGRNRMAHPDMSDLEQEDVRTLLFHIADLLARIQRQDQADTVSAIRDNLALLSHIPDLWDRMAMQDQAEAVAEDADSPKALPQILARLERIEEQTKTDTAPEDRDSLQLLPQILERLERIEERIQADTVEENRDSLAPSSLSAAEGETSAPLAVNPLPSTAQNDADVLQVDVSRAILGDLSIFAVFAGLTVADLARFSSLLQPAAFYPGERIYAQGDSLENLYLLQQGTVRIEREGESRPWYLNPGSTLGVAYLMSGSPSREHAVAASEARVIALSRAQTLQLARDIPRFLENLWKVANGPASPASVPADVSPPASEPPAPAAATPVPVPADPPMPVSHPDADTPIPQTETAPPPVSSPPPAAAPVPQPAMENDPFLMPGNADPRTDGWNQWSLGGKVRLILLVVFLIWGVVALWLYLAGGI